MGADVLGYSDIRISTSGFFGYWAIHGHSFQARMLKLGMNDHLMGLDVLGSPDIRISAFEIFGFFRILGLCGINFEAIMLKLVVDDNHMVPDV